MYEGSHFCEEDVCGVGIFESGGLALLGAGLL